MATCAEIRSALHEDDQQAIAQRIEEREKLVSQLDPEARQKIGVDAVRDQLATLRRRHADTLTRARAQPTVPKASLVEGARSFDEFESSLPKGPGGQGYRGATVETRGDLVKLVKKLTRMAEVGAPYRGWLADSVDEILNAFQGSMEAADTFLQMVAILSANREVKGNETVAENAMRQFVAGQEIKVALGDQNSALNDLLYFGIPWSGRKTNAFYLAMASELWGKDLTKDTVQDVYMARAIIDRDNITDAQYDFAHAVTAYVGERIGVTPTDAQLGIWVAQKAISVYRNYLDKGFHSQRTEAERRALALREAEIHYGDAVQRNEFAPTEAEVAALAQHEPAKLRAGNITVTPEVKPSTQLPVGNALDAMTHGYLLKFQQGVLQHVFGPNGADEFFRAFGLDRTQYRFIPGNGGYDSRIAPNLVATVRDEATAKLLAKAWMYVFRQDAVPYYRADPSLLGTTNGTAGTRIEFAAPLSADQLRGIYDSIRSQVHPGLGLTQVSPNAVEALNFSDLADADFFSKFKALAMPTTFGNEVTNHEDFRAQAEYPETNWAKRKRTGVTGSLAADPNGRALRDSLGLKGQPALLKRLDDWADLFGKFAADEARGLPAPAQARGLKASLSPAEAAKLDTLKALSAKPTVKDLQDIHNRITAGWKVKPAFNVAANPSSPNVPTDLQHALKHMGPANFPDVSNIIEAVYDPDTDQIWAFVDHLKNVSRAEFVIAHEITHKGLANLLGDNLAPVLDEIYLSNRNVAQRAVVLMKQTGYDRRTAVEEVLADMGRLGIAKELKGWARLAGLVRDALSKLGFTREWSDDDVMSLVAAAAQSLRDGNALPYSLTQYSDASTGGVAALTKYSLDQEAMNDKWNAAWGTYLEGGQVPDAELNAPMDLTQKPMEFFTVAPGSYENTWYVLNPDGSHNTTVTGSEEQAQIVADAMTAENIGEFGAEGLPQGFGSAPMTIPLPAQFTVAPGLPGEWMVSYGDGTQGEAFFESEAEAEKHAQTRQVEKEVIAANASAEGELYVTWDPEELGWKINVPPGVDPLDANVSGKYSTYNNASSVAQDVNYENQKARRNKAEFGYRRARATEQTKTAKFLKWLGESTIRNEDGVPFMMYHGTVRDIEQFQPKQAGAIFLTFSPKFAQWFAQLSKSWVEKNEPGTPAGHTLYPLYVRAEKPFDYEDPDQVQKVVAKVFNAATYKDVDGGKRLTLHNSKGEAYWADILPRTMTREIVNGAWVIIESQEVQAAIKALGHDSFWMLEDDEKNLAVYDRNQVKSVYGNSGEFSRTDPRIRFSIGPGEMLDAAVNDLLNLDEDYSDANYTEDHYTPDPTQDLGYFGRDAARVFNEDLDSVAAAASINLDRIELNKGRQMTKADVRTVGQAWLDLAKDRGLYSYPSPPASMTKLNDIITHMATGFHEAGVQLDGVTVKEEVLKGYSTYFMGAAALAEMQHAGREEPFVPVRGYTVRLKYRALNPDTGTIQADTREAWIKEDSKGFLALSIADFRKGSRLGSLVYQAVGVWAARTDRFFMADPGGLSINGFLRRPENLMVNALRTQTTDHLGLHSTHSAARLASIPGDTAYNVGAMAIWLHDIVEMYQPEVFSSEVMSAFAEPRPDALGSPHTAKSKNATRIRAAVKPGERTIARARVTEYLLRQALTGVEPKINLVQEPGQTGAQAAIRTKSGRPPLMSLSPGLAPRAGVTAATIARLVATPVGAINRITDSTMRKMGGQWVADHITSPVFDRLSEFVAARIPERVKAGLVSDYGLPEPYLERKIEMQVEQRRGAKQVQADVQALTNLTREQSRVAYLWMTNRDADALLNALPPDERAVLERVKSLITDLGREAVDLGQLTQAVYDRNKDAYLHRTYAQYELDETTQQKAARSRAIKLLGDQYRGRGIKDDVEKARLPDDVTQGQKFVRYEKRSDTGRLTAKRYVRQGDPVPDDVAQWTNDGLWEARWEKDSKHWTMWRDFNAAELERMGELDEVKYAVAKTMLMMVRNIETGRFLKWVADNHSRDNDNGITVVETPTGQALSAFKLGDWVKVPDTTLVGTQVKAYGALAGKFIPAAMWNDIRQVTTARFNPFGEFYTSFLRAWKVSKTALSPAVHLNNIMSNFVMADWDDISADQVGRAMQVFADAKLRGDADAQAWLDRFEKAGGELNSYALNELQRDILDTLLDDLRVDLGRAQANGPAQMGRMMRALQVVNLTFHGQFREAFEQAREGSVVQVGRKAMDAMIRAYQSEDQVFRLAAYMKAIEEGKTEQQAAKLARNVVLDYNINAPWVQNMRQTLLPFVAFTYRAAPKLLEALKSKPWKFAKYYLMAGGLNAASYAALGLSFSFLPGGGSDEDRERKLLPDERSGRMWGVFPRLMRMPWNYDGQPVFLDIRRWIPVGDLADTSQGHAAVPWFQSILPTGPLMMIGEIALNKSSFTGKPITLATDTPWEITKKMSDYLYKSMMPNLVGIPGTYATTGVVNAASGKTDPFGRELSTMMAVANSVGVKLGSYPEDVGMRNLNARLTSSMLTLDMEFAGVRREFQKHGISEREFQSALETYQQKKMRLRDEFQRRVGGE